MNEISENFNKQFENEKKNDNLILYSIIFALLIILFFVSISRTIDLKSAEQVGYLNCMNNFYAHFNSTIGR